MFLFCIRIFIVEVYRWYIGVVFLELFFRVDFSVSCVFVFGLCWFKVGYRFLVGFNFVC